MNAAQHADYSTAFLDRACQLWQFASPELVSQAENLIFACHGPAGKVALRLTHPLHRSQQQLEAELDWIDRLARSGVSVVTPCPSLHGERVECITIGSQTWFASATEWIDGQSVRPKEGRVSDETIQQWGALTGQITSHSLALNATATRLARPHWNQPPPDQPSIAQQLGPEHAELASKIQAAQALVAQLPQSSESYLLAHTDLHSGNVFQDKSGRLVALDFDDACYHYLLQELAMPIYYSLLFEEQDTEAQAKRFFRHFLAGYRKFHDIGPEVFEALPLFFALRDLDLEAITHLWQIPADSKWAIRLHHIYQRGNPICAFPWRRWAEQT